MELALADPGHMVRPVSIGEAKVQTPARMPADR
jgi:hypothetical protein